MKTLSILILVALAAFGGWWLGSQQHSPLLLPHLHTSEVYQCPMHPWVKSDKPGNCSVCGMKLVLKSSLGDASSGMEAGLVMLPPGGTSIVGVRTEKVLKQPLVRTMRVAGTIEDDDSHHRILSSYSKGRIEKLFINFDGAEVKAGQPLATFYSQDLLSAGRDYKLAAKQGSAPLIQAATFRLRQFGLTPQQIQQIPSRSDDDLFFEILSPLTGTVVKRHVYEGQYIEEGAKLFELADFGTMWFQFVAYEQDLPFLKVGQMVAINSEGMPGKTLTYPITFINPNMDDMTRSARVRVEIHTHFEAMRHRLYAEGTVALEAPVVLTVARTAVLWPGNSPRVYVDLGGGNYQQRSIKLGRQGDSQWEVLGGLKEGEAVVTSGNMLLDSQAQFDSMSQPASEGLLASSTTPVAAVPASPVAMSGSSKQSLQNFLAGVASVSSALADDNLAAFNEAVGKVPAFSDHAFKSALAPARDLEAARRVFLPFSEEVSMYALSIRSQVPEVKVFRCLMSQKLWKGAPKSAKWLQFTKEVHNPYFGKEMADCGEEVQ